MTVKKQHSVLTWLVRACGAFAWRRASPSFRPASGRGDRVLSPAGRRCRRRWVSRPALRRRPPRTGAWGVPASDEGRMSLDDVVHAWVLDKRVQRSSTRQRWGSRRWLRASEMGPWLASPAAQWPRPAPPWGRRWLATRRIYMHGPLILVQDTQRCPHLKGVGGGWLSAWVLWMELKSTRMPVVPGEHAQDVDEVVAVSRRATWPPGRRRRRRRHVCVLGGSRSSSSRVSHCGSRGWWAGDSRRLAIAIPW